MPDRVKDVPTAKILYSDLGFGVGTKRRGDLTRLMKDWLQSYATTAGKSGQELRRWSSDKSDLRLMSQSFLEMGHGQSFWPPGANAKLEYPRDGQKLTQLLQQLFFRQNKGAHAPTARTPEQLSNSPAIAADGDLDESGTPNPQDTAARRNSMLHRQYRREREPPRPEDTPSTQRANVAPSLSVSCSTADRHSNLQNDESPMSGAGRRSRPLPTSEDVWDVPEDDNRPLPLENRRHQYQTLCEVPESTVVAPTANMVGVPPAQRVARNPGDVEPLEGASAESLAKTRLPSAQPKSIVGNRSISGLKKGSIAQDSHSSGQTPQRNWIGAHRALAKIAGAGVRERTSTTEDNTQTPSRNMFYSEEGNDEGDSGSDRTYVPTEQSNRKRKSRQRPTDPPTNPGKRRRQGNNSARNDSEKDYPHSSPEVTFDSKFTSSETRPSTNASTPNTPKNAERGKRNNASEENHVQEKPYPSPAPTPAANSIPNSVADVGTFGQPNRAGSQLPMGRRSTGDPEPRAQSLDQHTDNVNSSIVLSEEHEETRQSPPAASHPSDDDKNQESAAKQQQPQLLVNQVGCHQDNTEQTTLPKSPGDSLVPQASFMPIRGLRPATSTAYFSKEDTPMSASTLDESTPREYSSQSLIPKPNVRFFIVASEGARRITHRWATGKLGGMTVDGIFDTVLTFIGDADIVRMRFTLSTARSEMRYELERDKQALFEEVIEEFTSTIKQNYRGGISRHDITLEPIIAAPLAGQAMTGEDIEFAI